MIRHSWSIIVVVGIAAVSTAAAEETVARGLEIARANCSPCHQIEVEGDSPLAAAPPFRELGRRYPLSDLEEALAEGIVTGHADMPEFAFDPSDAAALIAYLESIQQR